MLFAITKNKKCLIKITKYDYGTIICYTQKHFNTNTYIFRQKLIFID